MRQGERGRGGGRGGGGEGGGGEGRDGPDFDGFVDGAREKLAVGGPGEAPDAVVVAAGQGGGAGFERAAAAAAAVGGAWVRGRLVGEGGREGGRVRTCVCERVE